MQGDGEYAIARDRVFDVVAEYLEGEGVAYQQEKAAAVLEHSMLIAPDWNIYSFWHPVLQKHFAARGLEDAVLRQGSVDLVLRYLGDSRWHQTIYYLAGLLDEDDATKLTDYLLDSNHLVPALICTFQARALPDDMKETVVSETLKFVMTAFSEKIQESSIEEFRMYLWQFLVGGEERQSDDLWRLATVLSIVTVGLGLEACIKPELQSMLQSHDETQCMIAFYWLNVFLQREAASSDDFSDEEDFSDDFWDDLDTAVVFHCCFESTYAWQTRMMAARIIPKITNREGFIPLWEKALRAPEANTLLQLLATLALLETEGDDVLRVLRYALDNRDAQVRLVAVWGMQRHDQAAELTRMIYDPNPIVAHEAALRLSGYYLRCWDEGSWAGAYETTPDAFKLEFESLIAPMVGKIPNDVLSEQFAELMVLTGPLDYLVDPLEDEDRIYALVDSIHIQWCWYSDDAWFIKDIGAGPAIVSAIWQVALAAPSYMSDWVNDYFAELPEEFLERVRLTSSGQLSWGWGELTDQDMTYIKEWTDHDRARDVTAAVLSGCYRARQKREE
jgi:hypothetical protein